jgi:uncharacterized membrane protein
MFLKVALPLTVSTSSVCVPQSALLGLRERDVFVDLSCRIDLVTLLRAPTGAELHRIFFSGGTVDGASAGAESAWSCRGAASGEYFAGNGYCLSCGS